jgi:hypothetical protein
MSTGGTFVSYRREDAAGFAGRLCDSIERLLPDEPIFRDVDGLSPGQDFVSAIDARLRQCRVCLAVIGRDWLNARDGQGRRRLDQPDDFVRLELAAALARPEVLVIPVLVEGAPMPPADALPAEIRGLARRQAVALRDDTWDSDVVRLVRSLETAAQPLQPRVSAAKGFRLDWRVATGVAALVVLALIVNGLRSDAPDGDAVVTSNQPTASPAIEPARPAIEPDPPATEPAPPTTTPAGARDLAIPAVSQVGSRGVIYTVMSARLEPGGSSDTLRLRIGLDNEADGGVNFWDNTFRLVVGGDVLAPNSNLNVGVAGRATSEGVVTFAVPPGTPRGVVRITAWESTGEIPLDFNSRATAGTATGSRSSRAIVTSIINEARPLANDPYLSATLTRVSTRRFANVLRLDLEVRLVAVGSAIGTGHLTLRLGIGEEVLAPVLVPVAVIDGGTTLRTAFAFEVPTDTTRTVLRATVGQSRGEVPLTLR